MTFPGIATDSMNANLTEDRADAKAAMDAERAETATVVTVTAPEAD
jgi:hypothetical protein